MLLPQLSARCGTSTNWSRAWRVWWFLIEPLTLTLRPHSMQTAVYGQRKRCCRQALTLGRRRALRLTVGEVTVPSRRSSLRPLRALRLVVRPSAAPGHVWARSRWCVRGSRRCKGHILQAWSPPRRARSLRWCRRCPTTPGSIATVPAWRTRRSIRVRRTRTCHWVCTSARNSGWRAGFRRQCGGRQRVRNLARSNAIYLGQS